MPALLAMSGLAQPVLVAMMWHSMAPHVVVSLMSLRTILVAKAMVESTGLFLRFAKRCRTAIDGAFWQLFSTGFCASFNQFNICRLCPYITKSLVLIQDEVHEHGARHQFHDIATTAPHSNATNQHDEFSQLWSFLKK